MPLLQEENKHGQCIREGIEGVTRVVSPSGVGRNPETAKAVGLALYRAQRVRETFTPESGRLELKW